MADYRATARSNYFKVKDEEAFETFCGKIGVEMITKDGRVGFICSLDPDCGAPPSSMYSEDVGDHIEIDLCEAISQHLVEGEVAIIVEAGHEKFNYVSGSAIAVNSKGKVCFVDINEIYDLAVKKLGEKKLTLKTISRAED